MDGVTKVRPSSGKGFCRFKRLDLKAETIEYRLLSLVIDFWDGFQYALIENPKAWSELESLNVGFKDTDAALRIYRKTLAAHIFGTNPAARGLMMEAANIYNKRLGANLSPREAFAQEAYPVRIYAQAAYGPGEDIDILSFEEFGLHFDQIDHACEMVRQTAMEWGAIGFHYDETRYMEGRLKKYQQLKRDTEQALAKASKVITPKTKQKTWLI